MFKKIEELSDRLLSRFVPNSSAAASCPCGSYPYTGPCWYYLDCGGGLHKDCYCAESSAILYCYECH